MQFEQWCVLGVFVVVDVQYVVDWVFQVVFGVGYGQGYFVCQVCGVVGLVGLVLVLEIGLVVDFVYERGG